MSLETQTSLTDFSLSVFDLIEEALLLIKEDGSILDANSFAAELFEVSIDELKEKNIKGLLIAKHDKVSCLDLIKKESQLPSVNCEIKLEDQQETILAKLSWQVVNTEGNLPESYYLLSLKDLSVHKSLEKKILHFKKEAGAKFLVSSFRHDFNNALGMIGGALDILKIAVADKNIEKIKEKSLFLKECLERAKALTENLSVLIPKKAKQKELISVNALLREVHLLFEKIVPYEVSVSLNIAKQDYYFNGNYDALICALISMVDNALDAVLLKGQINISVEKEVLKEEKTFQAAITLPVGSYLKLSVSDNGKGIDPLTQKDLFKFGEIKEDRLGLSIILQVALMHGGAVEFFSHLNKGTTFNLLIPLDENNF